MTREQIAAVSIVELVGLAVIIRLWLRPHGVSVSRRVARSAILLIPLLGVLFYGLTRKGPGEHPYDTSTVGGSADSEVSGVSGSD
jgi:hypothetical protein